MEILTRIVFQGGGNLPSSRFLWIKIGLNAEEVLFVDFLFTFSSGLFIALLSEI